MNDFAMNVETLVKVFHPRRRPAVTAVDGMSFEVRRGQIFGLLGPNGAGKTTTLKMLTTLLRPTSGGARVLSYDVTTHPLEVRRRIPSVLQETAVEMFLSVRDNLLTFARFHGLPAAEARRRAAEVLERFQLSSEVDRKVQDSCSFSRARSSILSSRFPRGSEGRPWPIRLPGRSTFCVTAPSGWASPRASCGRWRRSRSSRSPRLPAPSTVSSSRSSVWGKLREFGGFLNRVETLLETALVRVERFDHPSGAIHSDPREEQSSAYSANFVESGDFAVERGRQHWQLDASTVFLTYPGLVYRCRHRQSQPDDMCFSVAYNSSAGEEVRFQGVALPLSHRVSYLRFRLRRWAAGSREPFRGEGLAAELWQALAEVRQRGDRLYPDRRLPWYCERVEAAREIIETRYAERASLGALGRAVGMSPFHLARVFRELVGTPPHRYLLRVRLARAAEQLRDGASVTETSFRCGFENLSHFIRSFRRAFGVTPSRF